MTGPERKRILRMVPYGLYVVTSRLGDSVNAFTASWLTQCSFHPPLLAVGVNRTHRSYELIRESGLFGVNFLGKDQKPLALHFLRTWEAMETKFGDVPYEESAQGLPILTQALAYLECRVRDSSEVGDHALFIGEILDGSLCREGSPLHMADTNWHYAG